MMLDSAQRAVSKLYLAHSNEPSLDERMARVMQWAPSIHSFGFSSRFDVVIDDEEQVLVARSGLNPDVRVLLLTRQELRTGTATTVCSLVMARAIYAANLAVYPPEQAAA